MAVSEYRTRSNSCGGKNGVFYQNNNYKVMSLKQLKEFIVEVFDAKFKHDQKCQEVAGPLETMDQFLYTFLSKKYGLKVRLNLISQLYSN